MPDAESVYGTYKTDQMIRSTKAALVLLLSAFTFASCEKGSDGNVGVVTPTDPSNKSGLNKLFAPLKTPVQIFSVTAGDTSIRYGMMGTKLTFYANSFIGRDAKIIDAGKVDVHLIEVYRPGPMAANRITTTSTGKVIMTSGMAYIKAFHNGDEVFPTKYGIGFRQPTGITSPVNLFTGHRNTVDSIMAWSPVNNLPGTFAAETVIDSIQSSTTAMYQFDSVAHFNWVAAGRFFNTTAAKTNLEVVIKDESFNASNTQVFLVYPDINSMTMFDKYSKQSPNTIFNLADPYLAPLNMQVHIIGIANKDGVFYYDQLLNKTTSSTFTDTLRFQPKSINDILTDLGGI